MSTVTPSETLNLLNHSNITIRDMVRYAITQFNQANLYFGHGSDNAYDEAVYLVLRTLHLPLDTLEPFYDAHITATEAEYCIQLIHKRVESRQPLAYLIGEAWLQGKRFLARPGVIVPRSPIAELLVQGLSPWIVNPDVRMRMLDMCTGSGCLAILASDFFANAHIDAVDISPEAIALATENLRLYPSERVNIIESDGFHALPAEKQYRVILCNPPYVNQQSMQNLPPEYHHEPELALAGGKDGMDFIRQFLAQARDYLDEDGFIVLEIGNEAVHFEEAFSDLSFTYLPTISSDNSIVLIHAEDL